MCIVETSDLGFWVDDTMIGAFLMKQLWFIDRFNCLDTIVADLTHQPTQMCPSQSAITVVY